MSSPAPATDSKKAPLITDAAPPAPPSYEESSAAGSRPAYGDGNVFSTGGMSYAPPTRREVYVSRSERKGWGVGFFSCFQEPGAAFKACCCPCVSYGQTRHRLHAPHTPAPVLSTACLGYCLTASFIPGAESIFGLLNRGEIRTKLGINSATVPSDRAVHLGSRGPSGRATMFENLETAGAFVDDAWRHLFCACCALTQEDREVRRWEAEMDEGEEGEGLLRAVVSPELRDPVVSEEAAALQDATVRAEGDGLLGEEPSALRGLRG